MKPRILTNSNNYLLIKFDASHLNWEIFKENYYRSNNSFQINERMLTFSMSFI